jgi:hypothetical protein
MALKSPNIAELVGATLGMALALAPLWLALLALGPLRPRIETVALLLNRVAVFLLACILVAIILTLPGGRLGRMYLPMTVLIFIASALNVAAINRQRKRRLAVPLQPSAPDR